MSVLPDNIGSKGSFLTDEDLNKALQHLFRRGTYDQKCIRHCSYQLRLGDKITVYKRPQADAEGAKYNEFLPLSWETDEENRQFIDIRPRKRALLYTTEQFQFPDDVLGLVLSRGLLFAKGLAPETTYVDPGFQSEFYITVVNVNENAVRLYRDTHLARLFVFRLAEPVKEAYVPGKAKGIEQQLLEIPVKKIWSEKELRGIKDMTLLEEIEKGCSIGELLNQMINRQLKSRNINKWWLMSLTVAFMLALIWPPVFTLLLKTRLPSWMGQAFFSGIIAPLAILGIVFLCRKGYSHIKKE